MARKNRQLTTAFNQGQTDTTNNEPEQVEEVSATTEVEEKPEVQEASPEATEAPVSPSNDEGSTKTIEQVKLELQGMYEEKTKKQTIDDTHQRATFLFRKDLAKRLDKLSKNKRGFKTMFLNKAIETLLDEYEK